MDDCIFCKIVSGDAPAYKIYEDKNFLSFLTIGPVSAGHSLVIPKQHFTTLVDMPDSYLDGYLLAIKNVSKILQDKLKCRGITIVSAQGKEGQQDVFHQHFHLTPRHAKDGLNLWFPENKTEIENLELTHKKLTT